MCVCVCVVCVCVFSLARETSQLERDNLELKDQIAARDAEIQSLRRYASRVPHNQWTLVRIATVESHLYHLLLLLTMPFTHPPSALLLSPQPAAKLQRTNAMQTRCD
jgi:hypothetical protein